MNEEEFIDYLILEGAVEVAGIDAKTGEFLYSFTEKLEQVDPEMYRHSIDMFQGMVKRLWEKGFLNMNIDHANPTVSLTEAAFDAEARRSLTEEESSVLDTIIEAMTK
jgi:hypothetical protein